MSIGVKITKSKYNGQNVKTCTFGKKKWFSLDDIIVVEGFDDISLDDICSIPKEHMVHLPSITENNRLIHLRFIDKPAINILKSRLNK